ncbi:MAG: dipeptidase [Bacteroidota bacterium]
MRSAALAVTLLTLALAPSLSGCASAPPPEPPAPTAEAPPVSAELPARPPMPVPAETEWMTRARELAQEALIVDGHIDVPYRLEREPADVGAATETGDFDYPRAKAGGLNAPFLSIYVPASFQGTGGAKDFADRLIDSVEDIAEAHPDKFRLAASPAEVRANTAAGLISLPLGMENGAPIEGDLANLHHFYDRGIRYITLTHGRDNEISDSSYDITRTHGGLSDFGREVVREMNRLGLMVDISHVSDAAFDDVMEVTAAPVIASHSSARHFTPGFERNLDDDRIRRLAEGGGVILITFGSAFLTQTYRDARDEADAAVDEILATEGLDPDSEEAREIRARYRREQAGYADLRDVVDHIDHVVALVGVEHVGLGSDFDGVGDSLPYGLKDVSMYPNLVAALLQGGYTEDEVRRILGENVLRVWGEVERLAQEL